LRGTARSQARVRAQCARARAGRHPMTAWSLHLLNPGQELLRLLEAGEAKRLLLVSRRMDEDDGRDADDRIALRELLHQRILVVRHIGLDARETVEVLGH